MIAILLETTFNSSNEVQEVLEALSHAHTGCHRQIHFERYRFSDLVDETLAEDKCSIP